MLNHVVTTYTRSIFDDDIEEGSVDDFSDESALVINVSSDRADMLSMLIEKGIALADGGYHLIDDENRIGYRAAIDSKDTNIIRFNLVHITDQDLRHLNAYDIEVIAAADDKKVYISTMPYMPFFTTILDMYNGDEAQKIDASIQQAIEDLSLGWLCHHLADNNVN
ncbi:hypothetical protein C9I87_12280 [Photobacterium iliopiscarium]|jgi:hypothetical protein|uniref:hypothetical protein n=1 Tax=Photobacterium iliopiscarium TaxID=56192 RepID=UPI000D150BCF|nr:hypothetical protein [Photobacterium iliopiscarium]PST94042.1 hypothetical protein C9I87_12280 [Photobacterium iliopiscarium]